MIENMSYLYYNVDFVTVTPEFSNYKVNVKADTQLSGRIEPGETKFINLTLVITVTNVERDQLPEVPQLF